jgi:Ca2+-binding EF-hand superfamily protein
MSRHDLQALFQRFDSDSDGYIDRSELSEALSELTGDELTYSELKSTLDDFDADGDGKITFAEFTRVMTAPEDVVVE